MTILHTYVSTYNDLYMIKHYVRHWAQYADKIFVYDDDSTDGTRDFLQSCAPLIEIKPPGFHGIDEILLQEMRSNEYRKHSRGKADWVVIGDSDEFHYHPNFKNELDRRRRQGFQIIISHGYQMLSESAPQDGQQMTEVIKEGIPDYLYNRVIFDPSLDIIYGIGHHEFTIIGGQHLNFTRPHSRTHQPQVIPAHRQYPIIEYDLEWKMLHYKYLGEAHIRERHDRVWKRLSARNHENHWGHHGDPGFHGAYSLDWYRDVLNKKRRVID